MDFGFEQLKKWIVQYYQFPNFQDFIKENKQKIGHDFSQKSLNIEYVVEIKKKFSSFAEISLITPNNFSVHTFNLFFLKLKDHLIKRVYDRYGKTKLVFQIVGELYKDLNFQHKDVCQKLSDDMTASIKKEEIITKHLQNLDYFLKENFGKEAKFTISKNLREGANDSFIVEFDNNERFFIKTFSRTLAIENQQRKIDCRELFLYKLLENTSIGPQTLFFLKEFSTNEGTVSLGNYIVTKDLTTSHKVENKQQVFYQDSDEISFKIYEEAFEDPKFLVEVFGITCLTHIFCIRDGIGVNSKNYGIVKTIQKDLFHYDLKLIDHLPICNNGNIFDYSPGKYLKIKFFTKEMTPQYPDRFSCFRKIIEKMTGCGKQFSSFQLGVHNEVRKWVENKNALKIIEKSESEIMDLVIKKPNIFASETIDEKKQLNPNESLKMFVEKIKNNYDVFLKEYHSNVTNVNEIPVVFQKCWLTIRVHKKTEKGEIVKIVGNLSDLGTWVPKNGLDMIYDEENSYWKVKVFIPRNYSFKWKFVLYNIVDEAVVEWEAGDDRISYIENDSILLGEWKN